MGGTCLWFLVVPFISVIKSQGYFFYFSDYASLMYIIIADIIGFLSTKSGVYKIELKFGLLGWNGFIKI